MQKKYTHITVLTGDLVRSTDLTAEALQKALETLERCSWDLEELMDSDLSFTLHRGDGWQVVIKQNEFTLRAMLAFRAALRSLAERGSQTKFDTRIAAASGKVILPLKTDLNQETQPVFIASGRCLEAMGKTANQPHFASADDPGFDATLALADYISRQWTAAQSQAIYQSLISVATPTDTAIGAAIGKSRQTIARALHGAGQAHINAALTRLEQGQPA